MTQEPETPKNRKQIGMADKRNKIYIEDYVVSYLSQIASDKGKKEGIAGLFGCCREAEDCREFYIYAAAFEEAGEETEAFRRESVQKIMRKRAESFADYFFLGWCFIQNTEGGAVWEKFYRSRLDSLMGLPELLLTVEKGTGEEHFYTYPTDMPKEADGYFIFYEQNERMQNFMVDAHWKEEVVRACEPDDVARSCREFYKEKKAAKKRNRLAIASCAVFVLLMIFALGSRVMNAFGNEEAKEVAAVEYGELEDVSESPELKEDFVTGQAGDDLGELPISDDVNKEEVLIQAAPETEGATEETSFKTTVEEDTETNPEESDEAKEEMKPEETVEEQEETNPEKKDEEACATYVVNKGDTLYGICMSFYGDLTLLDEICSLNEIEDMDNILCGQKILLPRQKV